MAKGYTQLKMWLKTYLRTTLHSEVRPMTRDALVSGARAYLVGVWAEHWSPATIAREMRRAIGELEREGVPIVSDGTGFRIATTEKERADAARKLERMGIACLVRAASIKRLTLAQEARQLGLFDSEGDAHAAG